MKPDDNLFTELGLEDFPRDKFRSAFCYHMDMRGKCNKALGEDCRECINILKPLICQDMVSVRDRTGLIIWRINEYAKGNLSVWREEPKKTVLPAHRFVDPLKDLDRILR